MRTFFLPLFAGLILLTGCGKDTLSAETREERDPFVQSGQKFMEEGKYDEAIAAFKRAIEEEPTMARPHLDLAIIYQQYKINYIHAIYHYDRYLELRPDAEKTDLINEQKLKVAQALANTLINNSPEVKQVVQERNQLIQQNNELKQRLASALKVQKTTATPAPGTKQTVTQTIPKTAKPAAKKPASAETAPQKHQIYHVVAGDTLSKIADKFYGDSGKWDLIFDANKDMMKSPGDLKVGQTLVIPAGGN